MKKYATLVSKNTAFNFYLGDEEFNFYIRQNRVHLRFYTKRDINDSPIYTLSLSKYKKTILNKYYKNEGLDKKPILEDILDLDFYRHLRINLLTNLCDLLNKTLCTCKYIFIDTLFDEVFEEFERDLKDQFYVHFKEDICKQHK